MLYFFSISRNKILHFLPADRIRREILCLQVASFAATMLATIPVLLGNEFDVNVGLKKRKKREAEIGENYKTFMTKRMTRNVRDKQSITF